MNKLNSNEMHDPNQNKYYKVNGNGHIMNNGNNNGNGTGNGTGNGGLMPRYQQHPALAAIINEAQGIKFRGGSFYHNLFAILTFDPPSPSNFS